MAKMGEKLSQMRAQWDRLTVRERRMLSTLAGGACPAALRAQSSGGGR
jgi:hypothetical protein